MSLKVSPVGTPVKRASNVVFAVEKSEVDPVATGRPANFNRHYLGSSCMTVASVEVGSTDIALSEIDAMIGRGTTAEQAGPSRFSWRNVNIELTPREELIAQKQIFTKVKVLP